MRRAHADAIDGVLALDKPAGISSNDALQQARRLLNARKAGHTGTLDPLASGLLPLTLGEATKFSADLLEADKEYEARIALGVETDSGDAEGAITRRCAVDVSREQFEAVLGGFVGPGMQVPPMHSALKHKGRPLYALAREGQVVERAARAMEISRLQLLEWDERQPRVAVACSKGTYIRVLAQQIGAALGCGAHLRELRRTRVGNVGLAQAVTLVELAALTLAQRRARLLAVDALLAGLARIDLAADGARGFAHGQRLASAALGERLRVYGPDGTLLGIARGADGWLQPVRLVAQTAGAAEPGGTNNVFGIEEVT